MRIQLTLSLSPSEAEQVVALVKTFKGDQTTASSELLNQQPDQSASAPDKKSPGRPRKSESQPSAASAEVITVEMIKPVLVQACQINQSAVEAELKRYGITKASEANPEQLASFKVFLEKMVAGEKALPI